MSDDAPSPAVFDVPVPADLSPDLSPHVCVCPGSFDPVTLGHLDVIRRCSVLFDRVVVAVLVNPDKQPVFTEEERVELLREVTRPFPNVAVVAAHGLLVDVCRRERAGVVVKGVRGSSDTEYELPMAAMNRHLAGVETLLLPSDPRVSYVSSSLVRSIASNGGDVSGLVPDVVAGPLLQRRGRSR
ncbi:MAG: pantetheine-phosphate adenylyltransferase [Actinomycetales bacterium]